MLKTENDRIAKYEIDTVFLERWSPRAFSERDVPEDSLLSLFEAAHWAPSAYNAQPWRFIIARSKKARETFLSFISESNRVWCEKAPVFALILSKKTIDHAKNRSHSFDAGAAWGYLSIQAVKKGLVTHPMTGFNFEKAREVLHIPEDYEIQALIAIGYQGEKELLPSHLQEREFPKSRHPLSELLYEDKFGKEWN